MRSFKIKLETKQQLKITVSIGIILMLIYLFIYPPTTKNTTIEELWITSSKIFTHPEEITKDNRNKEGEELLKAITEATKHYNAKISADRRSSTDIIYVKSNYQEELDKLELKTKEILKKYKEEKTTKETKRIKSSNVDEKDLERLDDLEIESPTTFTRELKIEKKRDILINSLVFITLPSLLLIIYNIIKKANSSKKKTIILSIIITTIVVFNQENTEVKEMVTIKKGINDITEISKEGYGTIFSTILFNSEIGEILQRLTDAKGNNTKYRITQALPKHTKNQKVSTTLIVTTTSHAGEIDQLTEEIKKIIKKPTNNKILQEKEKAEELLKKQEINNNKERTENLSKIANKIKIL